MPGGLPGVEQSFSADASGYISGIQQMIAANRELIASVSEAKRAMGETGTTPGGGTAADIAKTNAAIREQLSILREHQSAVTTVTGATAGFGAAHAAAAAQVSAAAAAVRDHTGGVSDLTAGYEAARASIAAMAADALRSNEQMAASFDRVQASGSAVTDTVAATTGALDDHARAADGAGDSVLSYARSIGLIKDAAKEATDALTDTAAAVTAVQAASSSGYLWSQTASPEAAILRARNAMQYGNTVTNTGDPAVQAALNSMLAASGGGPGGRGPSGGGGGGGFGSFASFFTGGGNVGAYADGTAGAAFANVARFVGQWYPAAHWAMMLTNELLATAGPAVVAGGAAAAVGAQGGQQLYDRFQALQAVNDSLGTGSIGNLLGVPGTLQQAQNQYGSGETYGLAGAAINTAKLGAGGPFVQLGQATMQMVDAAAANFVLAMKGGLGQQVANVVSGGAGYLQQFGDVLGNIGSTFLHVAPELPGVGGDLLSTLQAATGGLSRATGALGPGLLPLLGFEAGARYGPTIVGGAGALLESAGAPLAANTLAGTGGILGGIGDVAGMAGGTLEAGGAALAAMTAPEIGAVAAAVLVASKGLTAKTAAQQQYSALASGMTVANAVDTIGTISTAAAPVTAGGIGALPVGKLGPLSDQAMASAIPSIGKDFANQMENLGNMLKDPGNALHDVGNAVQDLISPTGIVHSLGQLFGLVAPPPSPDQAAFAAMAPAFNTWSNLLGAPGQVQSIWKGAGGGAISTSEALDVLAQSGVNITTAFQNNKLTPTASQEIRNYEAGYQAITGTGQGGAQGGVLDAINAVAASGGLAASKLSTVNSAFDQMTQIVSGGAGGSAAYTGLLTAAQAAGGTLGDVTNPANTAAWTAFASTTQPSVISQLQQQTDWLRTVQTLGALGGTGGTGVGVGGTGGQAAMAKYLIGQGLASPGASSSPMAMSMLASVAQEYGMAPMAAGESAKTMDQQLQNFLKGGDSAKQYNAALTKATENVQNMPQDAQQFVTTASSGFQTALAQGIDQYGVQAQSAFMGAFAGGKGPTAAQVQQYAGLLKTAGFSSTSAADTAEYAAHVGGASQSQLAKIRQEIELYYAPPSPPKLPAPKPPPIVWQSVLGPMPKPGPAPKGGPIIYPTKADPAPPAPPAPRGGVIVYTTEVVGGNAPTPTGAVPFSTAVTRPASAGITPTPTGGVGNARYFGQHLGGLIHAAGGFMVPGTGSGDVVPAMLEPGEAVVPRNLVGLLAPFLAAHGVPGFSGPAGGLLEHALALIAGMPGAKGFAAGGVVGGNLSQINSQISSAWTTLDALYKQENSATGTALASLKTQIASFWKETLDPLYTAQDKLTGKSGTGSGSSGSTAAAAKSVADQFVVALEGAIKSNLTTSGAAGIAQGLVSQIQTEINYANTTSAGIVSGLNFGSMAVPAASVAGSSTPAPPGAKGYNATAWNNYVSNMASSSATDIANGYAAPQPQSVQQQMQSYLSSVQQFQSDVGTLSKGHLNKALLQQVISAGPGQGDALAQSIIGGQGGISAVNNLYTKINTAANKFGMAAAGGVYGGSVSSGSVGATVNNVSVNVSIGGGGSALDLSAAQIKTLTADIQAALLKQAKRNRGTNLTLKPPKTS